MIESSEQSWTCLEPDAKLVAILEAERAKEPLALDPTLVVGDLGTLAPDARFDTILYIDVLEHIEDDHGELARAAERLAPGGHLIVLSPAYAFLFRVFMIAIYFNNISHSIIIFAFRRRLKT